MAAAAQIPQGRRSIFEELVKPAIMKLVSETDGSYRCERDLHHHGPWCYARPVQARIAR
jgi:hypothetical protein